MSDELREWLEWALTEYAHSIEVPRGMIDWARVEYDAWKMQIEACAEARKKKEGSK